MKRRGFSLTVAVSMLFLLVGMPLSLPSSAGYIQ
jgi:hypothetical protein